MGNIAVVVVTYNRKALLSSCIDSLFSQTIIPDTVIVTDNASIDGTEEMLKERFPENPHLIYVNLGSNLGGAGGFHFGAKLAIEKGADWVWLMDDDCLLQENCLECLLAGIDSENNIYSPIILSMDDKKTVLWGIDANINTGNQEVITLPFNGFLIHRDSISDIGYPEKDFFIYGDDTEYNLRAKSSGRKVIMVTNSVMYHPHKNMLQGLNIIKMFMSRIWVYYKLRNAIIIFKKYKYYSINQIIMFMSSLAFYVLTLKFQFINLWLEGLIDGLKNRVYIRDFDS